MVRLGFSFISKKLKKPNRTEPKQKKPEKPEPNQENPSQIEPKPSQIGKTESKPEKTEPNRFELVFVLKNRTEPKPVGLNRFRFF